MEKRQKRSTDDRLHNRGKPKLYHTPSNSKRPWLVSWRHDGKRERWTYTDEGEARDKLNELLTLLEFEGVQGIRFGAVARAEWNAANELLEPVGASVIEAARFYLRHHGTSRHVTWPDLVQSWEEEMEAGNRRESTIKGKKRCLKAFADYAKARTLADLSTQNIREFLARPAYTPATVASYRLALMALANHAKRRGWIRENPVDAIPAPKQDGKQPTVLTVRESNAVLGAALEIEGGRILKQMILRILAGLRPSEAEAIPAKAITADAIRVGVGKIRGRRSMRIVSKSDAFRYWWTLAEQKKLPLHPVNFPQLRRRAFKLAGVSKPLKDIERHTYISCTLATIHDENRVARMAGNSPQIIYSNYFQVIEESEARQLGISSPIDKAAE